MSPEYAQVETIGLKTMVVQVGKATQDWADCSHLDWFVCVLAYHDTMARICGTTIHSVVVATHGGGGLADVFDFSLCPDRGKHGFPPPPTDFERQHISVLVVRSDGTSRSHGQLSDPPFVAEA